MENDLFQFMKKREIAEDVLQKLNEDKVSHFNFVIL